MSYVAMIIHCPRQAGGPIAKKQSCLIEHSNGSAGFDHSRLM